MTKIKALDVFIVQKGYLTKAPYNPCNLHLNLCKQL